MNYSLYLKIFLFCTLIVNFKEKIRTIVYLALEAVKRRQYKAWLNSKTEEERNSIQLDPFVIAEQAITNCRPRMKLTVAVRGGITYQVPSPIDEEESIFRAMKSIREVCRSKTKHGVLHFEDILANELLAASKNEGFSIQAKQELHKLCEANRAFAHYRST
uniref:Ribosomal_S7 domain-containing protein n=1 Tax=Syphacia muris TaxID=451379 RepID=A0A0N5B0U5_9BILA